METITIIALIIIGIGIGFILIKGLTQNKKPSVIIQPKVDNPPTTKDKVITLYNVTEFVLTKEVLLFNDIDGDKITNVRFKGDVERFFTDEKHTVNYISGTELPIDFKIYVKFKSPEDSVTVNYDVKSNNIWSK